MLSDTERSKGSIKISPKLQNQFIFFQTKSKSECLAAPEGFTIGNEKWKIVAKLLIFGLFSTFWQRKSKYRNQNVTTPFSHPEKDCPLS